MSDKSTPYAAEHFEKEDVKSVHVTVRLSGKWLELWNELREDIDAPNNSAIIKEALRLRGFLLHQQQAGKHVSTTVGDGNDAIVVDDLAAFLKLQGTKK